MEVVNHLENSLERISTGNLYTPPSIHTATQTDTHMCMHYLRLSFHLCYTWMRIYNCFRKVISSTSEIPHLTEQRYYGTLSGSQMLCQPCNGFTATSVRIFEERRKLMSPFSSSIPKKLMVIGHLQTENTEINSTFERLCAQCYKKEGEKKNK